MNQSLKHVFFLQVIFNEPAQVRPWAFSVFFFIYIVTVTLNLVLILLITFRKQLHKPIYIFLAYLLFMDVICSTSVLPRLMYSLIVNNKTGISVCFIQAFFISFSAGMGTYILGIMAIDRYLAVCHPLRYNVLITNSKAHRVMWATLCWCFLTTGVYPLLLLRLTFCKFVLPNVGCVAIAVAKLSCDDITVNSMYGIALSSFMLSYIMIIVIITYGFILYECLYSSKKSEGRTVKSFSHVVKHLSDSLFYLLQPLANPIVYGFRVAEIRRSFLILPQIIMQKLMKWLTPVTPPSRIQLSAVRPNQSNCINQRGPAASTQCKVECLRSPKAFGVLHATFTELS
uniref:olfactory receptor 5H18-like n=1 Tax=Myxine glutinosa TaxID=7769 RepID=UPI00358F8896